MLVEVRVPVPVKVDDTVEEDVAEAVLVCVLEVVEVRDEVVVRV